MQPDEAVAGLVRGCETKPQQWPCSLSKGWHGPLTPPPRPMPPRSSWRASPRASASPARCGPPAPPPATASAPWASPRASSTSCRPVTAPTSKTPPGTSARRPVRHRGHRLRARPWPRHAPLPLPGTAQSPLAARPDRHRRQHRTPQPTPPGENRPRDHQQRSRTTSTSTTSNACAHGEPSAKPPRAKIPDRVKLRADRTSALRPARDAGRGTRSGPAVGRGGRT